MLAGDSRDGSTPIPKGAIVLSLLPLLCIVAVSMYHCFIIIMVSPMPWDVTEFVVEVVTEVVLSARI